MATIGGFLSGRNPAPTGGKLAGLQPMRYKKPVGKC